MVNVPRLSTPRFQERVAQGPTVSPNVPIQSTGGGPELLGLFEQASGLSSDIRSYVAEERRKAEEVELGDISAQLTSEVTRLKTKISQAKGRDAFEAHDQAVSELNGFYEGLEGTIANQRLRSAARERFVRAQLEIDAYAQPYAAGQMLAYDNEVTQARIEANRNSVLVDDSEFNSIAKIQDSVEAIRQSGSRNGKSKEWIANREAEIRSDIHSTVIDSFLSKDEEFRAKSYFKKYSGQMIGDSRVKAEGKIKIASTKAAAYQIMDQIFATNPNEVTLSNAESAADELAKSIDPGNEDLRAMANSFVRNKYFSLKEARAEDDERTAERLFRIVESKPGLPLSGALSSKDLSEFNLLPESRRRAIRQTSNNLQQTGSIYAKETDPIVEAEVRDMSRDELISLTAEQKALFAPFFSRSDYEENFVKRIDLAKSSAGEFDSGIEKDDEILEGARILGLGGILPEDTMADVKKKEKKAKAYKEFFDKINKKIESESKRLDGKKVPRETIRRFIGEEISKNQAVVNVEGVAGGFFSKPISQISESDIASSSFRISPSDRSNIQKLAEKAGIQSASRSAYNKAYIAYLNGEPEEKIIAILKGE